MSFSYDFSIFQMYKGMKLQGLHFSFYADFFIFFNVKKTKKTKKT